MQLSFSDAVNVSEKISEQSGVIGEKIEISDVNDIHALRVGY